MRAALARAAAAPGNSCKSGQLRRLASRHELHGVGGNRSGSGGDASTASRHLDGGVDVDLVEHLPPRIPGIPDAEVSDAWTAAVMHATSDGVRCGAEEGRASSGTAAGTGTGDGDDGSGRIDRGVREGPGREASRAQTRMTGTRHVHATSTIKTNALFRVFVFFSGPRGGRRANEGGRTLARITTPDRVDRQRQDDDGRRRERPRRAEAPSEDEFRCAVPALKPRQSSTCMVQVEMPDGTPCVATRLSVS